MEASTAAPGTDMPLNSTERKLVESARQHLGDDQVLAVFRGQTFVSPVVLPLLGPLLLMFVVKPRSVIVTGRSVVTVEESTWSESKVVAVVSRHQRGSVPVELTRWSLKIDDDKRIFSLLSTFAAMKEAASLARVQARDPETFNSRA